MKAYELLTFVERMPDRPTLEIRCNFGMFAGREATPAELDDLAREILHLVRGVTVVSEHRIEVGPSCEAALHQVRIELRADKLPTGEVEIERLTGRLLQETERWAESCISNRSLALVQA
jgi:hypothetical protein